MLNITFARQYRNEAGKLRFIYHVHGTPAELEAYEQAQGEWFSEDEEANCPVFNTGKYVGETCDLLITKKGKVVADTGEFDRQASLISQFGGDLGKAMAEAMAAKLINKQRTPAPAPATTPETEPES